MISATMKSTMTFLALFTANCSAALRGAEGNLNDQPHIQYPRPGLILERIHCDRELRMEITCRDCDFETNTARSGIEQTEATLDVLVHTLSDKSWQLTRTTMGTNFFPIFEDMFVSGTARNAAPGTPLHTSWTLELSPDDDPKHMIALATATLKLATGEECVISQTFDSMVSPFNTVVETVVEPAPVDAEPTDGNMILPSDVSP